MKTITKFCVLFLVIFPVFLFGCSDDDDDPAPVAYLRVLHGSPNAPDVDVLIDDRVVLQDVSYKSASQFLPVTPGTRNIKVNAAGTSTTVIDADLTLARDSLSTVIATGFLDQIMPLVLSDDDNPPSGNLLKLRVVHGSPSAPPVDVYVTAPGVDLATTSPTLTNVSYTEFSDFLEISEGDYQIRITPTGSATPVYDSGTVPLSAGSIFTLVALDATSGASPVTLVALTNDPAEPTIEIADNRARLRAVHASPNAPSVDILVDNDEVATDIAFKAETGYLDTSAGARNIKVNATGTQVSVIDETVTLDPGADYTVLAANFLASIEPLVIPDIKQNPTPGNAFVRAVHASPDAPEVDVLVDDTTVLTDIAFKDVSDYLEVPAGQRNIKVNIAGTGQTVIDVTPTLMDGKIYTVVALNSAGNIEPIVLEDN